MTLTEYIATLGANDWSVSKGSLTEGQLTVTYHVPSGEENPHTEGVGATIGGEGWHYRLTSVTESEDPNGGGHTVTQVWTDPKGVLDKIPCFVKSNLPLETRKRITAGLRLGNAVMVSAAELLSAASAAATKAGYSIEVGNASGECMIPWMDSNMTIGQVLEYVARWVPNLTTRSSGTTLEVVGGYVRLDTGTAAKASVACTPNMKTGTLTVGSTVVDLAGVYARNAQSIDPLNWYAHYAALIADELAYCAEASVMAVGNTLYLTARERGAAGNDITLELEGVEAMDGVAHATLYPAEDLSGAGTLSDGENEVELEVSGTRATGYLIYYVPVGQGFAIGGEEHYITPPADEDVMNAEAWNTQLRASGCPVECVSVEEATGDDEVQVNIHALVLGTAGNDITLDPDAGNAVSGRTLTGGEGGGRTIGDLVEAINAEDAFEFTAGMQGGTVAQGGWLYVADYSYGGTFTLKHGDEVVYSHTFEARSPGDPYTLESIVQELEDDGWPFELYGTPENNEIDFKAKEAGERWNTELSLEGEMFSTGSGTSGGTDGDRITLTAKEAGSGGNDLNARADGCFGTAGAFSGGTDASSREAVVTPFHGGEDGEEPEPYNGLLGQRPSGAAVPTWPVSNRTREANEGDQQCSCVVGVREGAIVFKFPEDANPYSVGAYIIDVPMLPSNGGRTYAGTGFGEGVPIERIVLQANSEREKTQPWNYVRGNPVPKGWQTATPGMKMTVAVGNPEAWKAFWSQFGDFDTLKRINGVAGIAFGTPAFFPVPADEAYPPDPEDEDKGIGGGTLGPAIKENGNAPANYRVLTPRDNMCMLVSGSFPASTHSSGNVGGLRFCHGTLKQYVWTTGGATGITPQEGMEFFEGTCKVGGRMRRYVCLSVKAIWINRRKKRFQNGTNRLAPSDPDYDEDKDRGKGWYRIGEEEEEEPTDALTTADYVEAARELWESSRNCGGDGTGESIQLHAVRDFNADLSVDDVFAKLGLATANGAMTYNAGAHTLEVNSTASQRDALGFEDYLLRIQARKQAEVLEWREKNQEREDPTPRDPADPTPPPTPQQVDEANEKQSYPMVNAGGISASHGVTGNGRPLDPFEVYAEDNRWYMNEGSIPHEPPINFPTTEITAIHAPNRAYFVKPYYDRTTRQWKAKVCWRARS